MIVVIEESVFDSPQTHQLTLLSLLHLGFDGRHRIQTRPSWWPEADGAVNRWLARQEPRAQEEIRLALEDGQRDDRLGARSDLTVYVDDVAQADWEHLRLPPEEARALLERPLHLLVENRHNDGAFLRMVAPEPWKSRLVTAIGSGRIAIEHGGGSTLTDRVEEVRGSRRDSLRVWALFDSDAREPPGTPVAPGTPAEKSENLRETCRQAGIACHRLERRESENYIPLPALFSWAEVSADETPSGKRRKRRPRTELRRAVRAFAQMDAPQRYYYNMRDGFDKDRESSEGIPSFYGDWSGHRDLQTGFKEDVRTIFHEMDFKVQESWLIKDGQMEEMLGMIQSIFRRL